MKRFKIKTAIIMTLSFLGFLFLALNSPSMEVREFDDNTELSQEQMVSYYKGKVIGIESEEVEDNYIRQVLKVRITEGRRVGESILVRHHSILDPDMSYRYSEEDSVVLSSMKNDKGEEIFNVFDYSRETGLFLVFAFFIIAILYFGRARGLGAILGLTFSIFVLIYYIVPNIVAGVNPVQVILVGVIIISGVSVFLAHGINRRTNVVWLSTVTTLLIAIFLSHFFIEITSLFGRGSDVAFSFQFGEYSYISLRGLFLAGLVIGVLGILTDVTSTQTAAIWEIKKANPDLSAKELYKRGTLVGREHIASLVNTLVLVYVGVSLPLFIIIMGVEHMPLWVILNSEPIAEEIVRAIIGSTSLILAVPISSFFASYFANILLEKEIEGKNEI